MKKTKLILGNTSGIINGDFGCQIEMVKEEMSVIEQLEKEYPTIAAGYKQIIKEQYTLFAKKHLDYGMSNISAGTQLANDEEKDFALTGLWYR
jgi:hypothetical protein